MQSIQISQVQPTPFAKIRRTMSYDDMLAANRDLPREALLLGMCSDGYPLLFNMLDSIPGPMLLVSDRPETSGREFIWSVALLNNEIHSNSLFRFAFLVGNKSREMGRFDRLENCLFVSDMENSYGPIFQLMSKLGANKDRAALALLLIDGVEDLESMSPSESEMLFWLLKEGGKHGLSVIVNAKASTLASQQWGKFRELFRTRIYGSIADKSDAVTLGCNEEIADLGPYEWAIREGSFWLRFISARV